MVLTDPVADMLSRIRNAIAVNRSSVTLPHSKMKLTIANQLKLNNFIDDVAVDGDDPHKRIVIQIFDPEQGPRITSMEKISKPGRRYYAKATDIPRYKSGRGIVIVSTSQGVMTGQEAARRKLGGELIMRVY